ncbi:MAG TPA: hypothetical protein VGP08_13895 [Pyrinomonadaceae bacterium]|jgi:hypothetical protein|nr:hypothetical protein [Pyrinomonadaceae bacterium]
MIDTSSTPQEIQNLTWWYNVMYTAYVLFGILTVAGTLFVGIYGSRVQSAIKSESDAKTAAANEGAEIARKEAAQANAEAAKANEGLGKSNEKIAALNTEAEALRVEAEKAKAERAEADKQIAIARADAAKANEGAVKASAEVARLQIVVANAETKRAEAERALLELQERIKPRRLTAKQSADFVKILKGLPNGTIDFGYTAGGSDEGFIFARQLLSLFKEAGWTIRNEVSIANHLDISVVGIGVLMRGPDATEPGKPPPPEYVPFTPMMMTLQAAFKAIGMDVQFINMGSGRDEKVVEVVVGSKPEP